MQGVPRYSSLVAGEEVEETALPPRGSVEEVVAGVEVDAMEEKVARLVEVKAERARSYKTVMQFTKDEEEEQEVPQNRTLWREGSREGYAEVRRRCREEGVTVGALTLAASYMAQVPGGPDT